MALTAPEEHILSALAASRVTTSAVSLAADLWKPEDSTMGADPVGYVQWVLDSLCERGLIVFRIKESRLPIDAMTEELRGFSPYEHFAYQIRLTQLGWEAAGYPNVHGEAGGPSTHFSPPRRPGDRTDYRTHKPTSEAHPAQLQKLELHEAQEPTHFHQHGPDYDDPMDALGQWKCSRCGYPLQRSGVCPVGCRRDSELLRGTGR